MSRVKSVTLLASLYKNQDKRITYAFCRLEKNYIFYCGEDVGIPMNSVSVKNFIWLNAINCTHINIKIGSTIIDKYEKEKYEILYDFDVTKGLEKILDKIMELTDGIQIS